MTREFKAPQAYSDQPRPYIELKPVDSNKIKAIGYDEPSQTLAVVFKNGPGAIYHYPNFTPEAHAAFVGAESMGRHFGQHIQSLPFEKYQPEPDHAEHANAVQAAAGGVTQTAVEA